jgi:hypothetical protein
MRQRQESECGVNEDDYDSETVNAQNRLVRFAHRNRVKRSLTLALPRLGNGKLLDYGCGSGVFLSEIIARCPERAIGYEPFMMQRAGPDLPIFTSLAEIARLAPFSLITLFETIEHLSNDELDSFLIFATRVMNPNGGILISAPIEIGPALIFKDLNRFTLRGKRSEHQPTELLRAAIFGIPAQRASDIKTSHRGFDFRQACDDLVGRGWRVDILDYGPLPIGTWYGNSQVYLWAQRAR